MAEGMDPFQKLELAGHGRGFARRSSGDANPKPAREYSEAELRIKCEARDAGYELTDMELQIPMDGKRRKRWQERQARRAAEAGETPDVARLRRGYNERKYDAEQEEMQRRLAEDKKRWQKKFQNLPPKRRPFRLPTPSPIPEIGPCPVDYERLWEDHSLPFKWKILRPTDLVYVFEEICQICRGYGNWVNDEEKLQLCMGCKGYMVTSRVDNEAIMNSLFRLHVGQYNPEMGEAYPSNKTLPNQVPFTGSKSAVQRAMRVWKHLENRVNKHAVETGRTVYQVVPAPEPEYPGFPGRDRTAQLKMQLLQISDDDPLRKKFLEQQSRVKTVGTNTGILGIIGEKRREIEPTVKKAQRDVGTQTDVQKVPENLMDFGIEESERKRGPWELLLSGLSLNELNQKEKDCP